MHFIRNVFYWATQGCPDALPKGVIAIDLGDTADLKVRFDGAKIIEKQKEVEQLPVINALTSTPSSRDVRVHDSCCSGYEDCCGCIDDNCCISGYKGCC